VKGNRMVSLVNGIRLPNFQRTIKD